MCFFFITRDAKCINCATHLAPQHALAPTASFALVSVSPLEALTTTYFSCICCRGIRWDSCSRRCTGCKCHYLRMCTRSSSQRPKTRWPAHIRSRSASLRSPTGIGTRLKRCSKVSTRFTRSTRFARSTKLTRFTRSARSARFAQTAALYHVDKLSSSTTIRSPLTTDRIAAQRVVLFAVTLVRTANTVVSRLQGEHFPLYSDVGISNFSYRGVGESALGSESAFVRCERAAVELGGQRVEFWTFE